MEFLPYVYLTYMFVSIYFIVVMFLIYYFNRDTLFDTPVLKKHFSVSVLIPAYNEEDSIEETVKSVLNSDYDNICELMILDNNSIDNTAKIAKQLEKRYSKVKYFFVKEKGKAVALNYGLKVAKGELVAVVDSDSFPGKDSIRKLVGFFSEENIGAATCPILARNKNNFFEKLQAFEYSVIAFTRKLLEYVDAIYVTPGPLALYRKKAIQQVGGFDKNNLTEDIEITWNLAAHGWQRRMCLDTRATTVVPSSFKKWYKQRERWLMGGMQTIYKYKSYFLRKGILGYFILPFFVLGTFLGLVGLSIFFYLIIRRIIKQYLIFNFSFLANTPVITLNDFYFTPSVLNYLGIVIFVLSSLWSFLVLYLIKEDLLRKENILYILFYMVIYLALLPAILITGLFKLAIGDKKW